MTNCEQRRPPSGTPRAEKVYIVPRLHKEPISGAQPCKDAARGVTLGELGLLAPRARLVKGAFVSLNVASVCVCD